MEGKAKGIGNKEIVEAIKNDCHDEKCPFHGSLRARGRTFEGTVIKKFPKRVVIMFERTLYVRKYERYQKTRTKIHARLPDCIANQINIGDLISVTECRPLSKIIHFVVMDKINSGDKK
ncbi:30S ribosomal protein S17 [Candidatus Pacearchaeota archaeon]|nr:30S ribosomal protein S17 [Candidatus Pacearchaeota archaeon]